MTINIFEQISRFALDRLRLQAFWVDGIEVTQAIQYSRADRHLTDWRDRGRDNSVTLVSDKAAWVRVYVHALFPVAVVRGSAVLQRRRFGVWVDSLELTPRGSGMIDVDPTRSYEDERSDTAHSLNFVIPAEQMHGGIRIKVNAWSGGRVLRAEDHAEVWATQRQTLRLRAFAIQYDGPDASGATIHLPAPTMADLVSTAAFTLLTWPVSRTPELSILGPTLWSTPLTGAITVNPTTNQLQCPKSWSDLIGWLKFGWFLDGRREDVMYFGLLPNGIPVGGAGGCGARNGPVATGFVNDTDGMAHELGHLCGFPHAPCGLGAGVSGDPDYPAYEDYDSETSKMASIGEYGLDVNTGAVARPRTARDTMSYCRPRWPSLYQYKKLLGHARLHPEWVRDPEDRPPVWEEVGEYTTPFPPDPPPWSHGVDQVVNPALVRLVAVAGQLSREDVRVDTLVRLEMAAGGPFAAFDDLALELLDASGRVLSRGAVGGVVELACGDSPGGCGGCGGCGSGPRPDVPRSSTGWTGAVEAYAEDHDDAEVIRLVRGDEVLWERRAGSRPVVADLGVEVRDDQLHVRWSLDAEDDTRVGLRGSVDDGRTWSLIALPGTASEASVPVARLRGRQVLVQAVVSDGFHTVVSEPVAAAVEEVSGQVAVVFPPDGAQLRSDRDMRLWGWATTADGHPAADDDLLWVLDGVEVGTGREVWLDEMPAAGDHEVVLALAGGHHRPEASARFVVHATGQKAAEEN
ncbi:hypothetical protein [Nocardioides sp. GXQ0305]|uniref:hypothetical protein n=1 Tax=Nocardioides sp. GXQ0305 TaxID=3423912 RepID=UPI003D7D01AB